MHPPRCRLGRSLLVIFAAAALDACGGGGGTGPAAAASTSWIAGLRYDPTDLRLSLSGSLVQYMYIDSGATNGVYPVAGAFAAELEAANPGLLTGACSQFTRMSAATIVFTDAQGVQAPSYVVSFEPRALGTCAQQLHLGAAGTQRFTVSVTP